MDELHEEGVALSAESLLEYQDMFHAMGARDDEELTRSQIDAFVAKTGGRARRIRTIANIVFMVFDHDGSGTISFPEFAAGLALIKAARETMSQEATNEFAWKALDLDHSGFIERRELLAWVTVLQGIGGIRSQDATSRSMMGPSSYNVSGGFSRNMSPEEITSKFMKLIDTNGDGKISKEEFFAVGTTLIDMSAVHKILADTKLV